MMLYRTPTPQFTTLIGNNIRHWQATVTQPKRANYLHTEQQNMYQSVDMGLQVAATMPTATALLLELANFVAQHGSWDIWIPLLKNALAAHPASPKRWELQTQLAFFYWKGGQCKTAVSLLNELLTSPIDINQRGRVHYHLGNSHFNLRQYNDAHSHALKALAIFENNPDAFDGGAAPALNLLGIIKMYTGKSESAIPLFQQAQQQWQQDGNYVNMLSAILNRGLAHSNIGQQEAAITCYQEAIPILNAHGTPLDKANIYLNLGTVYSRQGKWDEAKSIYLQVDRTALYQQGHLDLYARIITSLGHAAIALGELKTAVSHTTEAITIWQQLGDELMEANALENLGDAHARTGNIPAARTSYQDGINLTKNHPDNLFAQQLQQALTEKLNKIGH